MGEKLLWKDFAQEECCDDCPLLKSEICTGDFVCYGGQPIEPPCCSFNDDTDLNEFVREYYAQQKKREEQEEARAKKEKEKKERARKAAETKRALRAYCYQEIYALKQAEKALKAQENAESLGRSIAEAFNFANEMFRYEERFSVSPEISEKAKVLHDAVVKAKERYEAKRKEFYEKRKLSQTVSA